jgi:hypothetical protein
MIGHLTFWEVVLLLLTYALFALVFVGLPLCLVGYIIHKVVEYRRSTRGF